MTKKEPAGCAWRANASASTGPRGGSLRFGLVGKVQRAHNDVNCSSCHAASAHPPSTCLGQSSPQPGEASLKKSHNLHLDHFAVAAPALISG